jgi:hypothetical protein
MKRKVLMTDDTQDDKKVLPFRVINSDNPDETYDDLDCDAVLEGGKGKLTQVIVIGFNTDNNLYLALSQGSVAENLLLLEYARLALNEYMMP